MAPTSDERREVAERLRKYAKTETASADYLWQHLEIAVNGWRGGRFADESYVFGNDVMSHLADLIDPTCHAVHDNPQADDEFICSGCGALVGIEDMFMSNYCEQCGARVVSD